LEGLSTLRRSLSLQLRRRKRRRERNNRRVSLLLFINSRWSVWRLQKNEMIKKLIIEIDIAIY
jgi:hypothetical protein